MTGLRVRDLLLLPHHCHQGLERFGNRGVRALSIDTRSMRAGDIFVAIRGERHDGHAYVAAALRNGASFCVVDRTWYERRGEALADAPLFVVRDTVVALGEIARAQRLRFPIPVIAVTGSNGKTTTREMIVAVLRQAFPVLRAEGNRNNHLGVPLTLLRLAPAHRAAVVEMGTNQPGDIAYLCSVALPTHGLITNIGHAHLERLKSPAGVAREKTVLFRSLPPSGVAFLNEGDPLLRRSVPRHIRTIRYGTDAACDVVLAGVEVDGEGRPTLRIRAPRYARKELRIALKTVGMHTAYNALAAVAVGLFFHVPGPAIIRALEAYRSFEKRMQVLRANGLRILDDTYNANPESCLAALDTLAAMKSAAGKTAILGDMLELGAESRRAHERVGRHAARARIQTLLTVGRHARHISSAASGARLRKRHFATKDALLRALPLFVQPGDTLLVKGSRGMRMEEVVQRLATLPIGLEQSR
jgi:UDP-N-acetylmuramoyl-tripeptide--D-alanyl-D-alanine ligase